MRCILFTCALLNDMCTVTHLLISIDWVEAPLALLHCLWQLASHKDKQLGSCFHTGSLMALL